MTIRFHDEKCRNNINPNSIYFLKDVLALIDTPINESINFLSVSVIDRYEFAACIEKAIENIELKRTIADKGNKNNLQIVLSNTKT